MTTVKRMTNIIELLGLTLVTDPGFISGTRKRNDGGYTTVKLFYWSANLKADWGKELLQNGKPTGYIVVCLGSEFPLEETSSRYISLTTFLDAQRTKRPWSDVEQELLDQLLPIAQAESKNEVESLIESIKLQEL